jgi:hypothetical protein
MKKFNLQHSAGVSFIPTPLFTEFNGDFQTIKIPAIAISWEYEFITFINYLKLIIDPSKCFIAPLDGITIKIYILHLSDQGVLQEGPFNWFLPDLSIHFSVEDPLKQQSHIILFAAYDINNNIISAFQRFYVNKDHNNITYPYDTQLFKACYAKPFTFILVPPVCGFFGSFPDLFSDFIALWEQGIIHN